MKFITIRKILYEKERKSKLGAEFLDIIDESINCNGSGISETNTQCFNKDDFIYYLYKLLRICVEYSETTALLNSQFLIKQKESD